MSLNVCYSTAATMQQMGLRDMMAVLGVLCSACSIFDVEVTLLIIYVFSIRYKLE